MTLFELFWFTLTASRQQRAILPDAAELPPAFVARQIPSPCKPQLFFRALPSRGPVFDPAKVTWTAASTCTPWPVAVQWFSSAPVAGFWGPTAPGSQSGPNGPPQGG